MAVRNTFFHKEIAGYGSLQSYHQGDHQEIAGYGAGYGPLKSRSEQAPGSEFHPHDESEKNYSGFLGPSIVVGANTQKFCSTGYSTE